MSLPVTRIKEGILHERRMVRDLAARYFSESYSPDLEVMPKAIEAIETHGWAGAFEFYGSYANLAQTEETLGWFIEALEKGGEPANLDETGHCLRVGAIVAKAPVALLMRQESRILGLHGLPQEYGKAIGQRLRFAGEDTDRLWEMLEAFCEQEKAKHYVNEVDLGYAGRLVEAIARDQGAADKALDLLSETCEELTDNPMSWMEPLAVELAGEMHLEPAVPPLVERLWIDADWLRDQCMEALAKIGTDAIVRGIVERFPGSPWHCKLYASAALEKLRSDFVVSRCLELAEREEAWNIKKNLFRAVLANVAPEGVEPVRGVVDKGGVELRRDLLAVSLLTDVDFPEREQWLEEQDAHTARIDRRRASLLGTAGASEAGPSVSLVDALAPDPVEPVRAAKKPGRNDPCPCGSGKKYKKCCMRKG